MAHMFSYTLNFYDDPLEYYKLPYLDAIISSRYFFSPTIKEHLHEVIYSTIFYQTIFILSRGVLRYFFKSYNNYESIKIGFCSHVVSMVQCVLIMTICFPVLFDQSLLENRVFASTPYGEFTASISLGYFIWDFLFSAYYIDYAGIGFVIHGLASSYVYYFCLSRKFIVYYGSVFMFFEASTPLLNIHWFINHLPENTITISKNFFKINGILFIIMFFLCRIVWGWYHAINIIIDFLNVWDKVNIYQVSSVIIPNMILNCLNLYWFIRIIITAKETVSSEKKKTV